MRISKQFLEKNEKIANQLNFDESSNDLKERIIQFGTGNFLRGLPDWLIQQLNNQGLFNGKIVMVKSTSDGQEKEFMKQDCLYTLLIRGVEDGKQVDEASIISSVSRVIYPGNNWLEYMQCAENPDIQYVFTNTTEAGIAYDPQDHLNDRPASSFPGKLTQYLYHRYETFKGSSESGMVIYPCELIENNGDQLKEIVLKLACDWRLPQAFSEWIKEHNWFLNTLVDRIIPGFPKDDAAALQENLGYEDPFMAAAEPYYLWAIEGGTKEIENRIPFGKGGLKNVIWDDIYPYKTRKVRILNGAHITMMSIGFLYGLNTVGECINHKVIGPFVKELIYNEIIPSIEGIDQNMLIDFAESVEDRFKNPYIHHQLLTISLNAVSKFRERIIPSIIGYQRRNGIIPKKLSFAFAAFIAFYRGSEIKGNKMVVRDDQNYEITDDVTALQFFLDVWSKFNLEKSDDLVREVLANESIWKANLLNIDGLFEEVRESFLQIMKFGMQKAIQNLEAKTNR